MSDDDVTERARRIVSGAMFGLTTPMMVDAIVTDLDAAGLLVTPERDAAVAARALREAADRLNRDRRTHDASCGESPARTKEQAGRDHGVTIGLRQAVRHLDERAAAIERGEP